MGFEDLRDLRESLLRVGSSHGNLYPWHQTQEPFHLLIAEFFLRRTTRTVVARVFPRMLQKYPTVESLAGADPEDVWNIAREAGLKQRTMRLPQVAKAVLEQGGIRPDRDAILSLPSVGPYIADAILLYAFNSPAFALDSSVQRVLCRAVTGADPKKNSDPYKDKVLLGTVTVLTVGLESADLRNLHQGLLYIAWGFCRPRPLCPKCPLQRTCKYGLEALSRTMTPGQQN